MNTKPTIIMPPKPAEEDEGATPSPNCTDCRYFCEVKNVGAKRMGGCHGVPPVPLAVGMRQNRLGGQEPVVLSFWPTVGEDDAPCSLFEQREVLPETRQ